MVPVILYFFIRFESLNTKLSNIKKKCLHFFAYFFFKFMTIVFLAALY